MVDEEKLRRTFSKIREDISSINNEILALKTEINTLKTTLKPSTHVSTHPRQLDPKSRHTNQEFSRIKPYFSNSIGNNGVSTDRQTHSRQTDRHVKIAESIERDLIDVFKSLTSQEFLIFSVLYTLQENLKRSVTYKDISGRIGLTESTVRDHISRLIDKGIPIIKEKVSNKQVILRISDELRKIATLENLAKLKGT